MDPAAALVLNVVLAVTSVVGAGVAIWQALDARHSKRDAEAAVSAAQRAAAASERQAVAAEKSVSLQEEQSKPKPWTAKHVSGDLYAFVNNLTEVLRVHRVEPFPEGSDILRLRLSPDGLYQPGDRLEFMYSSKFSNAPHKLVLHWSYEHDEEQHQFILPL
ncbi:hypothetical protein [Microbacterium sp. LWH11-1.2]|uniref:hypothetical protein n=1 Tax=Microbacterium sp. LWH11-1.2 TaxID=3135258 RepID=UPI003138C79E